MSKVLAKDIKKHDFVTFDAPAIPSYTNEVKGIKGMIQEIKDYNLGGKIYKYVSVMTDSSIRGFYLDFTTSVIKEVISDEEREVRMTRNLIRNLPRTVPYQGSDPEIFVLDKNGMVIPSFEFLPSKKNPVYYDGEAGQIFWDGYQAEFNVRSNSCLDIFVSCTQTGLRRLNELAKAHDKDARLSIIPTVDVPPHMLANHKEEHVQFGCMPSKNVYNMKGIVADGRDVPFRSAGGHIHLQLSDAQKKRIPEYVKALDAILGVACVSMFGSFDDARRREYYGLAGEYRTPSHGLEYRPLSNVWMCHPTAMYIVYELARKVISLVDGGLFKHWKYEEQDVISCINECNIPMACMILEENEEMFKDILASFCYKNEGPERTTVVFNTFMFGIENLIDKVDNVEENWNLLAKNPKDKLQVTSDGRIYNLSSKNSNYKKVLEMKV